MKVDVLPADSWVIPAAYEMALELVNLAIASASPLYYRLAVYNLGTSNVITMAPDQPGKDYYEQLRKVYMIEGFAAGVVSASNDVSTGSSLEVIRAAKDFTMANLRDIKDPYGRRYVAIAQDYGTIWGLS